MASRRFSLFARNMPSAPEQAPPPTEDGQPSGEAAVDPAPERVYPPPRQPLMRRERNDLMRRRETEIRDVGGLALEMYRRDRFKPDLLLTRCAEVLSLEERILELDSMLAATEVAARGAGAETCACGAPIVRGAHFCSHCGRPASATPPVATCGHCAQPLPADANFCLICGNAVAADAYAAGGDVADETMVAPSPAPAERERGVP